METEHRPIDFSTAASKLPVPWGSIIRPLGLVGTAVGIITALAGTAGLDDQQQILIGCMIAGFSFTWTILGQILHTIESHRS